jgi:hypothetical protein
MELSFAPSLDKATAESRLDRLLVPGSLADEAVARQLERLERAFNNYAQHYPLPLWAPGLLLTNEMRGLTEALFPISQLRAAFELVLRRGCRFPLLLSGSYLYGTCNWLDLLQKLRPQPLQANPAALLRDLVEDAPTRRRFLFSLLLPHHFGGGFDRYPAQSLWIADFLRENFPSLKGKLRALDCACGSGEGTYGLAELLVAAGFSGEGCLVHGSTLEPIELFAAAHLFFPHDEEREKQYRARVAPLFTGSGRVPMEFYLDEIGVVSRRERYQLILCNGLLGGPLLHEPGELAAAFRVLASRLAPGGVLLAADRFHAGWRLRVPADYLSALLREQGLTVLQVPEGIAGRKADS